MSGVEGHGKRNNNHRQRGISAMQSEVRVNDARTIRPYKHNDSKKIQMDENNDNQKTKSGKKSKGPKGQDA